ncbi:hypothetical protein LS73_004115 [Helicobacter muridarum]|uniref:Putative glycoprotease family protein n=1 Tax=Helicobacter muridarum TaxID=216 RepID=A0A377PSP1_9HELI|nr:hypothetical protein [Helicobacter muridarum]TLE00600.1 hypothetical protein LS73_004115 [Helicobacter muridarum]STQ85617.1 putative glycoprotease family protein [Helicobacter muridarum]
MNGDKAYLALISTQSPVLLGIYYENIIRDFNKRLDSCDASYNASRLCGLDSKTNNLKEKRLFAWFKISGLVSDILPFIFGNILICNKASLHSMNSRFRDYDCRLWLSESMICSNSKFYPIRDYASSNEIIDSSALHDFYISDIEGIIALLQSINSIGSIYYARGTGSLSAIKFTHIFLQTLIIARGIPLRATNIFYFNTHDEIKAFGNQSFFYKDSQIRLGKSCNPKTNLTFPTVLHDLDFCEACEPLYVNDPL